MYKQEGPGALNCSPESLFYESSVPRIEELVIMYKQEGPGALNCSPESRLILASG